MAFLLYIIDYQIIYFIILYVIKIHSKVQNVNVDDCYTQGDKFSMYVIVPKKKNGLDALIDNLGPNNNLTQYLKNMLPTSVNLLMPKFEFDYSISLRPALEEVCYRETLQLQDYVL